MPDRTQCNRKIGRNLRDARLNHTPRWSQEHVALLLGISTSALSHVETGRTRLRLDQAIVLEERLGITLVRLCNGTPIDY